MCIVVYCCVLLLLVCWDWCRCVLVRVLVRCIGVLGYGVVIRMEYLCEVFTRAFVWASCST
jgi:hypothetical protein